MWLIPTLPKHTGPLCAGELRPDPAELLCTDPSWALRTLAVAPCSDSSRDSLDQGPFSADRLHHYREREMPSSEHDSFVACRSPQLEPSGLLKAW